MEFPTITVCPLYDHETFMNVTVDTNNQIASLEDHFIKLMFNKTVYTVANISGLVSRVVFPNAESPIPHACVRVSPQRPITPGLHNQVSQILIQDHNQVALYSNIGVCTSHTKKVLLMLLYLGTISFEFNWHILLVYNPP